MGLNDYSSLLAEVDGATSISAISLVDTEVESFSPYIYVPTPWVKHTKNYCRGAPNLGNLSCSKLFFLLLLLPPSDEATRLLVCEHTFYSKKKKRYLLEFHCLDHIKNQILIYF
jgi:hypothetical protein